MGEEQKKVKKTTTKKTKATQSTKKTTAKVTKKPSSKRKISKKKETTKHFFLLEQPEVLIRERKEPRVILEQPELTLKIPKATRESHSVRPQKKQRNFHTTEVVILVVITALVGIFMGVVCCAAVLTKNSKYSQLPTELQEFVDNYNYIVDNYYEEIDKEELIDHAISGMLESLDDPYSNYMDETTSDDFDLNLTGTYKGLGIEVYNDNEYNIIVSRVFENTPAYKAGIQVGDILVSLDGESMVGRPTTDFADRVKGGTKETYAIEVKRGDQIIPLELTREVVIIPSVYSNVYTKNNKKIGYLEVTIFSATTYNQFKTKLEALEKEGIEGLVIDLRDNSGGHLNVVTDMISLFLDKSNVIYQIQSKSGTEKFYSTGNETKTYPIVVLQNQSSASASELMAAALKEQYGAKIVGMTSYGKGTVQELKELSDGTQYKFTTKKWLTPNGNWINEVGVKPDVEVDLLASYFENPSPANDNQLQTALDTVSK